MATTEQEMDVRPRAAWYALPVGLWVVALVLFGLLLAAIAHVVNNGVDPVRNHGTVSVPSGGLTFYTTDNLAPTTCRLTRPGAASVPLKTFSFTFDFGLDGPTYYALGATPHGLAAGTYRLDCTAVAPTTRLGTGPHIDETAIATRALWGLVLPVILGVAGLAILVIVVVKRHGSKSRIRTRQAYAASGFGSPWNARSGYPGSPPPPPTTPPPPPPPQPPPPPPPPPPASSSG
jgi:hypothetical protein